MFLPKASWEPLWQLGIARCRPSYLPLESLTPIKPISRSIDLKSNSKNGFVVLYRNEQQSRAKPSRHLPRHNKELESLFTSRTTNRYALNIPIIPYDSYFVDTRSRYLSPEVVTSQGRVWYFVLCEQHRAMIHVKGCKRYIVYSMYMACYL